MCNDVYRTNDTPTCGSGSITLHMSEDIFEVNDYQILLCADGCNPSDIVSRASQGYAPVYQVIPDGEIKGNFQTFKFKMAVPELMADDLKRQGNYEDIAEQTEENYYYLLAIDKNHYAYIHLERRKGMEKFENEAELTDTVIKKAEIDLNLNTAE